MNPVAFYKSLADETRLKALLLISDEGELCVCELMAALKESQPKVSRHLAQLRQNQLLLDRRQGQWVFYHINSDLPAWAHSVLAETAKANSGFLSETRTNLQKMGNRPERESLCCA